MYEVKIFANSEFGEIRTVTDRVNSVWFCGSDVAKALGYERGAKAVADHIDSEDKHRNTDIIRIFVILPDSFIGSLHIPDWRAPFISQLKLRDLRSHIVLDLDIDFRPDLFDSIINRLETTLIIQQKFYIRSILFVDHQCIPKHLHHVILRNLHHICKDLFSSKLHDNPPLSA